MDNYNISKENWDKIIGYASVAYEKYKSEIGGMAVMCRYYNNDNEGRWFLERPVILKQEISAGNTIIDKEALAEYYTKEAIYMEKEYPKLEYRFLWWHSHHTMKAFWSGTDLTAIDEFSDGDLSFALVVNLDQEYKFRVNIWNPVQIAEDTTLNIINHVASTTEMEKEVKELCTKEAVVQQLGWNHANVERNIGQSLLWGEEPDDKMDEFMNIASYDPRFQKLYERVDQLVDGCMEGKIDPEQFVKEMRKLERQCRKDNYEWKVVTPTRAKVIDAIMYSDGAVTFIQPRKEL